MRLEDLLEYVTIEGKLVLRKPDENDDIIEVYSVDDYAYTSRKIPEKLKRKYITYMYAIDGIGLVIELSK